MRLKLWTTCIPAVLTYNLHTLHLAAKHIDQLQAVVTRQLRAVAKSPSHLTHETTEALHGRQPIRQIISEAQHRLLQNLGNLEAEGSCFLALLVGYVLTWLALTRACQVLT